jgi:alpha-tubulin suppressor-like RCC1 family protein
LGIKIFNLGQNNNENSLIPKQLLSNIQILQVSLGEYHSLILSKTGEFYTFGAGSVNIFCE